VIDLQILNRSPFDATIGYAALVGVVDSGTLLLPGEAAVAPRGMSLSRRLTFDLGRGAAHAAMARLGRPVEPVLRAPRGTPLWPVGLVGTISHTVVVDAGLVEAVYAVAAVADAARYTGLGLDIERVRPMSPAVLERIASPDEVAWVNDSAVLLEERSIAVFAAREALYKAVSPGYGSPMRYAETTLVWDGMKGGFRATTWLPADPHRAYLESFVSIDVRAGCVLAAVALPSGRGTLTD
jgi:4'-phosphopantetheinyl transferase EntD